jgi:tol-pal system protein YbgF
MRSRFLIAVLLSLTVVLLTSTGCPVRTQRSDQVDAQMADLQHRVEALEQQQASLQHRFEDSTRTAGQALAEYERLQEDLAALQGRFDEVQHGSQGSQDQMDAIRRQLMIELDKINKRLTALENHQVYTPEANEPTVDEMMFMNQAVALFNQGNYEAAKAKFADFLKKFKNNKKCDEAQFFLAECYFKQGNWERAILEFDAMITRFPASTHVPAAYLHMGIAFYENGQISDARLFFQKVIQMFPGTPEAKIAEKKLQAMH